MAHLGRPKGEFNEKYSLAPVAEALSERLGQFVALARDVSGEDAHERANGLADGDVVLVENVRFDPRETSKDEAEREAFAAELAALAADNGALFRTVLGSCIVPRHRCMTWLRSCLPTLASWWRRRLRRLAG